MIGVCLNHNGVNIDGKWFYLPENEAMDVFDEVQALGLHIEFVTGKNGTCTKCIEARSLKQRMQRR